MPEIDIALNDWFYMKTGPTQECKNPKDPKCEENKSAVSNLRETTNDLGAWTTQYNDAKLLFNRELLFTVNLIAGLAMICYYIYVNQSVVPSPMAAIKGMGEVGNKMGTLVNSVPAISSVPNGPMK
jgi:hypothetical protein